MATIDYKQKIKDYMNSSEVDTLYKSMLNNLFPELKENKDKDEKTRKSLIILLQHFCKGYRVPGLDFPVSYKDMLAWLEKQGEHSNFLSKIQVGDKVTRNEDGVLVNLSQLKRIAKPAEEHNITGIGSKNAQGKLGEMIKNLKPVNEVLEQKPDWNEKYIADVFEKVGLAKIAREQSNDNLTNALQDAMIELSKFIPQPKQEWSEEDEYYLNSCITKIEIDIQNWEGHGKTMIDVDKEIISWLKSLRLRNTWKPSDEQIKALKEACDEHWEPDGLDPLYTLYQDLKKLKGE